MGNDAIKVRTLPGTVRYDGSQLEPLWAYSQGISGHSIVLFRGSMDIPETNIRDFEDRLGKKAIRGGDLLHFIVEFFDSPASIRLAYYMQRLLVSCARDVLLLRGVETIRNGDDLFVKGGKLTVSIASAGITSEKVHMGINISCEGTPPDVKVACLEKLGITKVMELGEEIASTFAAEISDIESDMVKTRPL